MDYDEQDIEVIRVLSKLKEAESPYPADMMASRRQRFVKHIAALGLGTGAALAIKEGAKAAGGSSIPPVAGTILETALIVAIVVEASVVAFVHRDKVLDSFRTISGQPTVQQVTDAPDSSRPLLSPTELIPTAFIVTAESVLEPTNVTATATAFETPSPETLVVTDTAPQAGADISGAQVNSTPVPNGNNTNNSNNGNHYGQTPLPERTKDNGNNGGGSDSNNNDNNGDNNSGNNGGNNNDNNGNSNRNNH